MHDRRVGEGGSMYVERKEGVAREGIEPSTFALLARRSNRLSYPARWCVWRGELHHTHFCLTARQPPSHRWA